MAYQRTKYPPWSWSSSRKSTFRECRRKYYYNYYLAHNGWEKDAGELSKKAYRLKNLTGIHLLLGSAVHEVAEYTCKILAGGGKLPEEKLLIDKIRYLLNQAWKDSKALAKDPSPWMENPKQYLMLYEFYYGYGISESIIERIRKKMRDSTANLLISRSINEIASKGYEVVFAENMDTFELYGTPVYAIPDLVLKRPDGKWIVIDWKTGKEAVGHPAQINVYCMYLSKKKGVPPEEIKGRVEYLLTGNASDVEVSRDTFTEAETDIMKSIDEMKESLLDPDKNIPKEMSEYPLTEHRKLCRWCSFYELCEDEL